MTVEPTSRDDRHLDESEYKAVPAAYKAEGDQGEYKGHFSIFGNVDDGDDIMEPGAFVKTIQERGHRVKVLYAHDWMKLIGPPPRTLREDDVGLFAAGRLTLASFWGKEAWVLMKDEALTEGSFRYWPVRFEIDEQDVRHLKEVILYEISPVALGMNPLTRVQAVKAGLLPGKRAIPPHSTDKAPDDTAWDAAAVLREVEGARKLRLVHAWVDDDGDPAVKESYKLPHHLADGRVVWNGVRAAGGAVMGARAGVRLPAADMPGVKRHLTRHYAQFDKTPPWEEGAGFAEYAETLRIICEEIETGRALVTATPDGARAVIEATKRALESLESFVAETAAASESDPGPDGPGVNHHPALLRRVEAIRLRMERLSADG